MRRSRPRKPCDTHGLCKPGVRREAERQKGREAERQRGREAERQRGREAERQRGREAERRRGGEAANVGIGARKGNVPARKARAER